MLEINVYVANLGKYNEGYLVGEWLELPTDEETINNHIEKVLTDNGKYPVGQYEEIAIHDYESPINVNEYDDIYKLNEFLNEVQNYDENIIEALTDYLDIEEIPEILRNNDFYCVLDVQNETELALKCDTELLPFDFEAVLNAGADLYLDYEQIGLTMLNNGWNISSNNIGIKLLR
ncbi:MAG: antirestriction protein ArdA [Fusobacteriaceae bacterium]|nr:antirestriction protein ArdA [Fusobacteriaceae bacterium]